MKEKNGSSRLAQKFSIKVFLSVPFTRLPVRVGVFYAHGRVGSSDGLRDLQKNTTFFKKRTTIAFFVAVLVKGLLLKPIACTAFHAQKNSPLNFFCDQGGNIGRFPVRVVKGVTFDYVRSFPNWK